MTKDWALGTGPKHRIFGPGSIEVENMKDAPGVNEARDWTLDKIRQGIHEPTDNYAGKFGPGKSSDPIKAGLDPTEQFVGSYRVDVIPDAEEKNLTFIVTNTTSFDSFLYGLGPDWNRNNKIQTPMGNIRQIYTWTERISK